MNFEYYTYIIAIILVFYLVYVIIYPFYCGCNIENFDIMNTNEMYAKIKDKEKSHLCIKQMDSNNERVMLDSKVNTFCKDFPDYTFFNSIITVFLENHTIINGRQNIKKYTTSDIKYGLNPEKSISLPGMYKTPDDLDKYTIFDGDLMEDECVALCEKKNNCVMSMVGNPNIIPNPEIPMEENYDLNRGYIGRCLHYNRDIFITDDKTITDKNNYKIFRRENTPEYSVTFWIKMNNTSEYKRNILFIGKNRSKIYTSIEIDSYFTSFTLYNLVRSDLQTPHLLEDMNPGYDLKIGIWYHVAYTISGNKIKLYMNGNLEYEQILTNNVLIPENDIPIRIASDAFDSENYSKSGYELSKFIWYPITLEENIVKEIALNTYPTDDFGLDLLSQFEKNPNLIILTNAWKAANKSIYGELEIILLDNTLVMMSGSITYGMINTIIGYIDTSKVPDREINVLVGGSNGYYKLQITTSGELYLYDINYTKVNKTNDNKFSKLAEYNSNEIIHLSNIRYTLKKGNILKNSWGRLEGNNLYVTVYYNTYLFSGTSYPNFNSGTKYISLPKKFEPSISTNNLVQINTENLDIINPVTVDAYNIKNVNSRFEVNLEGFIYSHLPYTNLLLTKNYVFPDKNNIPGYIMSGNIITLKGLVKSKKYTFRRKKSRKKVHFRVKSWDRRKKLGKVNSDKVKEKRNYKNLIRKCSRDATNKGKLYFKVVKNNGINYCYSSLYYRFTKPLWKDFQEYIMRFPGVIAKKNKLRLASTSITTNIYKTFPGLLNKKTNKNQKDRYLIDKSTYNLYNFPIEQLYDMFDEYKRLDIPKRFTSASDKHIVAIVPESANSFSFDGDYKYDFTYLAPHKKKIDSLFLTIGTNQTYVETIWKRGNQKYIDFTDSYNKLEDGTYDVRIYTSTNSYFTLLKFSKYNNTYTSLYEYKKIKKNLFQLDNSNDVIAIIPERYRPYTNSVFTTFTNGGIVNIMITTEGKIINLGLVGAKYLPGANIIDLGNISYIRKAEKDEIEISKIPTENLVSPSTMYTSTCIS